MVLIHTDGRREVVTRSLSGLLTAEEIIGGLGGRWRVVGQSNSVKWLALAVGSGAEQNMAVSLMVGQMVFGPVLECERGKEIR